MLKWLAIALAVLVPIGALGAWVAPAVVASQRLPQEIERFGVQLELGSVRPAWPLGFTAESARIRTTNAAFELSEILSLWQPSEGLLGAARLGTGSLEIQTPLDPITGTAYARGVPLEAIELSVPGVSVRGRLTAVVQWEQDLRFSARVQKAGIKWAGGLVGTAAEHLSVLGDFSPVDQRIRLERIEGFGPNFMITGSGELAPAGELTLNLEVQRLSDPLLRLAAATGIPVPERFPARYAISGTVREPLIELIR